MSTTSEALVSQAAELTTQAEALSAQAEALAARATLLLQAAVSQSVRDLHPTAHIICLDFYDADPGEGLPAAVQFTDGDEMLFTESGEPIDGSVPAWAVGMEFAPEAVECSDGVYYLVIDEVLAAL